MGRQSETHLEAFEVRCSIMASFAVVDYVASISGMSTHSTSSCTTVETPCDLLGGEAHPRLELWRGFDHDVKWDSDR